MNEEAKEMGLRVSRFSNPHGLPDERQQVTMREMALLAAHLIRTHPDRYPLFGQRQFTFRGITYRNRNPLLGKVPGVHGLKTGQTAHSGFALVASMDRNGKRLILAMNGLKSEPEREAEARNLLERTFGQRL
jgi:D-alanyl-D-alanine carboxypeptidase (penicillin-binding protein 5/6)